MNIIPMLKKLRTRMFGKSMPAEWHKEVRIIGHRLVDGQLQCTTCYHANCGQCSITRRLNQLQNQYDEAPD